MKMTVRHYVSEAFRKAQAAQGIGVPDVKDTVFEPPYPPEWVAACSLNDEGTELTVTYPWRYKNVVMQSYDNGPWILPSSRVLLISATDTLTPDEFSAFVKTEVLSPEQEEHNRKLEQEEQDKKAREQDERNRVAQEKEAQEKARTDLLRAWALEHGSGLLKKRLTNGFDWVSIARDEYANQVVAEVSLERSIDGSDAEELTDPTEQEIDTLLAVRSKLPAGITATLYTVLPDTEDGDDDPERRTEIKVTVPTPDGAIRNLWFLVE